MSSESAVLRTASIVAGDGRIEPVKHGQVKTNVQQWARLGAVVMR